MTDKFTYSAYGEVTHVPSSNDYLASFTGKEYDATGLIYIDAHGWANTDRDRMSKGRYNARYLDPVAGRFLTEDPSRDGTNWYGYCNNNPVNMIDPTGMVSSAKDDYETPENNKDRSKKERIRKAANKVNELLELKSALENLSRFGSEVSRD